MGAPFAGEEGHGAVYIYHGSKKGIITQVSQVVEAKDVGTGLSTFGSALSAGWDQDGNLYPGMNLLFSGAGGVRWGRWECTGMRHLFSFLCYLGVCFFLCVCVCVCVFV